MGAQEISVGAVVEQVGQIYRDQAPALLGTAVVLFALQFLVYLLLPGIVGILGALIFWVLSTLYQGMVVKLVQDVQDGRRDNSVGDLIRSVEPVVLPLMGLSIVFGVCVGIGFLLLIVPGLFLLTIWSVATPVLVLERRGIFASLGRSREMVRGRGWKVFGVIVVVYFAVMFVSIIAGLASTGLGTAGHGLVEWVVATVLAPVAALAATVLYFALGGERQPIATPGPVAPTAT